MSNGRAKRGGEIGTNGDFYVGGTFLPSTERPKSDRTSKRATRKREVAPYVWEVAPAENMFPLYQLVGSMAQWDVFRVSIKPFAPYIGVVGPMYHGHHIDDLCAAWNRGERWVAIIGE